jgi:hypothetical protein
MHSFGGRKMRRALHYLMFGAALLLAVSALAARAAPSWALDKSDPDPTTLCTDPDGCDPQGPDDPNLYTWDGAVSASPSGSDLEQAGYTCGFGSTTGAPWRLNSEQYGCWKGATLYTCTPHSFLWWSWATNCVLKP